MPAGPNVCRRRLAADLRRLRDESGFTIDHAAEQVGISKSALSRIEVAKAGATVPVVRSLLQIYGVSDPRASELIELAKEARAARRQGWWMAYGDILSADTLNYMRFESEAVEVCSYAVTVIPGILQTEPYTEAVLCALGPLPQIPKDSGRLAEVRRRRQDRIGDFRLWLIIDEGVLRRPFGGVATMREQLHRIIDVAEHPNVTIQILPNYIESNPGVDGPFLILKFVDDDESRQWYPNLGFIECQAGAIWLDKQSDVARLGATFDRLRAAALSPDASRRRIAELIKEFPNEDPR